MKMVVTRTFVCLFLGMITTAREALNVVVASKHVYPCNWMLNLRHKDAWETKPLSERGVYAITTSSLVWVAKTKARTFRAKFLELVNGLGAKDLLAMVRTPDACFHILDTSELEWEDIQGDLTRYPQFDVYSIRKSGVKPFKQRQDGIAARLDKLEGKMGEILEILKRMENGGGDFEV